MRPLSISLAADSFIIASFTTLNEGGVFDGVTDGRCIVMILLSARPSRPNAISMPALEAPSLRDRRRHAEKVGGTACPRAALGHWASIMRSIAVLRFRVL